MPDLTDLHNIPLKHECRTGQTFGWRLCQEQVINSACLLDQIYFKVILPWLVSTKFVSDLYLETCLKPAI